MNYHSDVWIQEQVREHFNEALNHFHYSQIVGMFYQGSGNYGLDTPNSDVDTKLIVVPSFKDLAMNHKPVSTTHVRANNEHIDFKDIRLYITTFRKQNINFLEILFTPYKIVNSKYTQEWQRLVDNREMIAHMDKLRCVETMTGLAQRKYVMMDHRTESKIPIINQYGYDPKELCHLMRIEEFCVRYIQGESFENCLNPTHKELLLMVKSGEFTLDQARKLANVSIESINSVRDKAKVAYRDKEVNKEAENLLDDVQYNIMKIAISTELGRNYREELARNR